jgi:hypothetical protein
MKIFGFTKVIVHQIKIIFYDQLSTKRRQQSLRIQGFPITLRCQPHLRVINEVERK